ncbi:FadR family transcriptional regulator [Candidatus Aerophobetes bacterium]|nr:FadR family transcriptional regulator [Candidatus Aerophobetes bacterium]
MKIVEQIVNLVEEGKLKPGEKLPPENILAEKFGASRPSVREALSALEILGIIESRGGKGNFIKNSLNLPSYRRKLEELAAEESPFELLEARKMIECQIASLAAERATEEDIAKIQDSLDKMRDALADVHKVMEYDREFHINLAKAAHNSVLFSMMSYLADGLREKLWVNLKEKCYSLPGRSEKYIEEHARILEAIRNKNSKDASKETYKHLENVEKDLLCEGEE